MPLTGLRETVRAGPASRKRTYEQITRSSSRSLTPSTPPSKRRRIEVSQSYTASPPRHMSASSRQPSPVTRYVGDGLDFRRPTRAAMEQAQEQYLIDLTLDEDNDEDEAEDERHGSPSLSVSSTEFNLDMSDLISESSNSRAASREPPFDPPPAAAEVIDISSDEENNNEEEDNSSDVEIVGQRSIPRRPVLPEPRDIDRRLRTPPELRRSNAQTFTDTLRPFANFWRLRNNPIQPHLGPFAIGGMGVMDQVNRIMHRGFPPAIIPEPLNLTTYDGSDGLDEYDNMELNYAVTGFGLEDPGADDHPVDEYKPPTAAKQGFTRDIEENIDVLVCVGCEDELAIGEDEIKQQVWVSKKCGHVYCGSCASRRVAYRKGNDRDRKRAKQRKLDELKECRVEGCGQKLTGKTAMFQIYL